MMHRTHARNYRAVDAVPSTAGFFANYFLLGFAVTARLLKVAIRLLAAFALLSAQVGASYSKTTDLPEPVPGGRLALVIGNSTYRNVTPLKNPGNDAKLIAETLRGLGFEVVEKTDLTRKGFQAAVDDVARKAGQYESVLLYYAGHGFQIDGNNYLVPVDSKLRDRKKFASETIDLNAIVGKLEGENRNTLILLDACRNNPAKQGETPANISEGLAQMETGNGTFVAFATQPGNITRDGAGENSPFSIALAEHMQTEGISISDMMIRVRNTVEERTAGEQTPWDQSSLRSQFYFNPTVEENDSLTDEDLALLEQLDPALREKFMKRFGLNLNEDGSVDGEEVVATVAPSIRIEADNAEEEEPAATAPSDNSAAEQVAAASSDESKPRTATNEMADGPRKPGLLVLAMPDEEPAEPAKVAEPKAPIVAKVEEKAPEVVALTTPEEIAPVVPKPEPAPMRAEPEKPVEQSVANPVKETPTQPEPKAIAAAEPAQQPQDSTIAKPGSALLAPLVALSGQIAGKLQPLDTSPAAKPAANGFEPVEKPATKPAPPVSVAKPAARPVVEPDKPVAPVAKPAETKTAAVKTAEVKTTEIKPVPAAPKPAAVPVPAITAKKETPVEAKPAPETVVALANPAPPAVQAPIPSSKLVPTPVKPAVVAAPEPTTPKLNPAPNPVVVAKAPPTPVKTDVEPANSTASKPEKNAAPIEPANVAAATPAIMPKGTTSLLDTKNATASSGVATPQNQPKPSGGLLTATAPAPPAPVVSDPAPVMPKQDQAPKEQLLAMADPAPATKLAPAASKAAATPAPAADPSTGKFDIPLPGDETDEAKKELAIKAQKELTRLGCYRNETDGDWGPRSARALLRFYAEQKLEPDQLEPTAALVERLTSIDKVICKNTETDRPKQTVKKPASKSTAKAPAAPAKAKAPVAQKAPAKAKPAPYTAPAVAKAKPAPTAKKKIDSGALIGAFR